MRSWRHEDAHAVLFFPVCAGDFPNGFALSVKDWTVLSAALIGYSPHLSWKPTLEDEGDSESSLSNLSIPDWPICYSCENFHFLEWVEWDFPLLQNILSASASSWLMLMKHGSWCSHRHLLNACYIHIWLAVWLRVSALKLDHPGFKFHPLYLLAEWPWATYLTFLGHSLLI